MRARARMRAATMPAVLLALAFACAPSRAAEESAGTRAAAFLSSGNGPAVLGMGGVAIGGGTGLQAASWNVAALASGRSLEGAFAHTALSSQGTQDWAAVTGRLRGGATRWAVNAAFRDEGGIDGRDANNQPTGEVSANSIVLGLQLARPLGQRLALGAGARVVSEGIGDSRGNGLAFDAGAQGRFGMLGVGVSGTGFGGGMRWQGQRWRMPATLGAGLALAHERSGLTLAFDVVSPANYFHSVRAGAQWNWNDRLALRGGYRAELGADEGEPLTGPSFGLGARAGLAWVDYALVVAGDGVTSHRFALSLRSFPRMPGAVAPAVIGPQPDPSR